MLITFLFEEAKSLCSDLEMMVPIISKRMMVQISNFLRCRSFDSQYYRCDWCYYL